MVVGVWGEDPFHAAVLTTGSKAVVPVVDVGVMVVVAAAVVVARAIVAVSTKVGVRTAGITIELVATATYATGSTTTTK